MTHVSRRPQDYETLQTNHLLSLNHKTQPKWLYSLIEDTPPRHTHRLDTVLQNFENVVNNNSALRTLAKAMFDEIPHTAPYNMDSTGLNPQLRDFGHALELINSILTQAPQWYNTGDSKTMGLIGFPINAILNWPMSTASGYFFFRNPVVNRHLQAILSKWGEFLTTSASTHTLNNSPNGWFSPDALTQLTAKGNNGSSNYTFSELYSCPDPSGPPFGFQSWDHFFTRSFNPEIRPVASPNDPSVIVHACESVPLQIKHNVQLHDQFQAKGQPYALQTMLDDMPEASRFAGGTVYQAFLSALSYHRWHAPVSGTIKNTKNVAPGTYFSESFFQGFRNPQGPDPAAANNSQPYLAEVAARAIVFIEADNSDVGLMGCVFIGMSEVSSCEITVEVGQRVEKGEELGMFHFGGSTHCLVFRPGTRLCYERGLFTRTDDEVNTMMNSELFVASSGH